MNDFDNDQKITDVVRRSLTRVRSGLRRGGIALVVYLMAMFGVGGFMLIKFPLEALIVILFIGSVFLMNRA